MTAFCNDNDLMTTIKSHEPFFDGFEARDSVITIFSCSDYGGSGNNAAILHMMKNRELVPKVLNSAGGKERWLSIEEFGGRRGQSGEESRLRQLAFTPPKR